MSYLIWVNPEQCDPPHGVARPEQVDMLMREFQRLGGWNIMHPCLVGYYIGDRLQLLSGSHRWAAAFATATRIPVMVHERSTIQLAWGDLDLWRLIMESGDLR